jgi:hypothetical protein
MYTVQGLHSDLRYNVYISPQIASRGSLFGIRPLKKYFKSELASKMQ